MLEMGEDKADAVLAFARTCQVAVLDTRTAIAAAQICRELSLARADATAQEHGIEILTGYAHFEGPAGCRFRSRRRRLFQSGLRLDDSIA